MTALNEALVEQEVIKVITQICSKMKIEVNVDSKFCPGDYIMSPVLLTFISSIGDALDIKIPNNCYIFSDNNYTQLSIQESAQKIIKVIKSKK